MPNLTINGQSYFADAPSDTPLLWVIREDLRLTGTKYGCGMGLCGSCTVHIDGHAVRSCAVTVGVVTARAVTARAVTARAVTARVVTARVVTVRAVPARAAGTDAACAGVSDPVARPADARAAAVPADSDASAYPFA